MKLKLVFSLTFLLVISSCTNNPTEEGLTAKNGMVVSAREEASKIGVEILKKGGNAIDAAVGVTFALAVTHPSAGNIGGGGFMIFLAKKQNHTKIISQMKKLGLQVCKFSFLN